MSKIVIINGSANVGKDTFVKLFDKVTESEVLNYSTIDNIRIAFDSWGYKNDKMEYEYRQLVSDIKSFLVKYNDIPLNDVIEQFEISSYFIDDFVMFVHCREPIEIQKLVNHFGDTCITLLIKRNEVDIPNNNSDKNVDNYNYDHIIFNVSDLENFEKEAILFAIRLKEGK